MIRNSLRLQCSLSEAVACKPLFIALKKDVCIWHLADIV